METLPPSNPSSGLSIPVPAQQQDANPAGYTRWQAATSSRSHSPKKPQKPLWENEGQGATFLLVFGL